MIIPAETLSVTLNGHVVLGLSALEIPDTVELATVRRGSHRGYAGYRLHHAATWRPIAVALPAADEGDSRRRHRELGKGASRTPSMDRF